MCLTSGVARPRGSTRTHHLSSKRRLIPAIRVYILISLAEGYKHVKPYGLHGTYDHALEWLKSSSVKDKPKTILWLGSSLGNFKRHEAAPFLAGFSDAIKTGDTMLIGIDSCKDPSRVYHAYNDNQNVTHEFILNGLKHANRLMEKATFKLDEWEVIGEFDEAAGRHHAFVSPLKDVTIEGAKISEGERIRIEESYKYSREEILELWEGAGLAENAVWSNDRGDYGESRQLRRLTKGIDLDSRAALRVETCSVLPQQAGCVCCTTSANACRMA
jgi:EasF-like predicted methyltransferase